MNDVSHVDLAMIIYSARSDIQISTIKVLNVSNGIIIFSVRVLLWQLNCKFTVKNKFIVKNKFVY